MKGIQLSQHERRPGQAAEIRSTAPRAPAPVNRAESLALQRTVGNAAVLRMLQLAGRPSAGEQPAVQRSAVHDVLRGGGRPLEAPLREEMEARLGADFTDVRIHDDSAARASAAEVGARAYTSGSHVVIGDGGDDRHTLAHELTHVIQQRQGPVTGTDNGNGLKVSDPSDAFEREAEANAHRALSRSVTGPAPTGRDSSPATAAQAGGTAVQRFMAPEENATAEWTQSALEYTRANKLEIFTRYARMVLGLEANEAVPSRDAGKIIKQLGIRDAWARIHGLHKEMDDGGNVDVTADGLAASLNTMVRRLNIMEQECATAAKVGEAPGSAVPMPGSVVGTEFTFTDSTLNGTAGGNPLRVDIGGLTGKADARARSAITYAKSKMTAWTRLVQNARVPQGFTLTVTDTTVKEQDAKRFTYTNGSTQWWWEITMDDACLETRTDPTSVSGLAAAHVKFILRNHIFALADSCGLHVDQSIAGGGGHISIDSASTFGGSIELLVQSMRQWEEAWDSWVDRFGKLPREKDVVNAPWTGDLPDSARHLREVNDLLDAILKDALDGNINLAGAIRQLQDHMVALPLHTQATANLREKVADHPEDRLHYQAVNLEHMNDATEAHRRVEFRDIQAQNSYEQLLDDLRHIGNLLQGVRDNVKADQQGRLDGLHP
ncbi:DUF4157 domain-containing protein [Streptomyces sp. NPDC050256]|uniref:DUF4157 domain-containing protein n=1 Tax=Streptomyces sp. NPDC050256 TaxID=3365607 RepID=UPI0037AD5F3B